VELIEKNRHMYTELVGLRDQLKEMTWTQALSAAA
jgi:hypothetical protein